jgi:hypothetical protein
VHSRGGGGGGNELPPLKLLEEGRRREPDLAVPGVDAPTEELVPAVGHGSSAWPVGEEPPTEGSIWEVVGAGAAEAFSSHVETGRSELLPLLVAVVCRYTPRAGG